VPNITMERLKISREFFDAAAMIALFL
jgi:hypothetical protein